MRNPRRYGQPPFAVAVVHGGPGAGGEMAPVARELASGWGVLEPIQTATSLQGQVDELTAILERNGAPPVTLIGYSWGAWLGAIVAACHPRLVDKLILVSSGAFREEYVARLSETRLSRLTARERAEFESALAALGDPTTPDKDAHLQRLGALAAKADAYDPLGDEMWDSDQVDPRGDVYCGVWQEAAEMRRSGELLALARRIRCPVVAIHGDYDPSPAEGVQEPLDAVLEEFRFVLLARCGHTPWRERQARDEFYRLLRHELP